MPRDDHAWLADMLLACRKVLRYTAGVSREEFGGATRKHRMRFLERWRSLVKRPETSPWITRAQMPDVPWTMIIAFRNRLTHGYFEINLDIVWNVVQHEIHALKRELESVVKLPDDSD